MRFQSTTTSPKCSGLWGALELWDPIIDGLKLIRITDTVTVASCCLLTLIWSYRQLFVSSSRRGQLAAQSDRKFRAKQKIRISASHPLSQMSCSANQRCTVKLIVDGVEDKIIPFVFINFSHPSIQAFQSHVMAIVRLHPGEPQYDYESIHIGDKEVDEDMLKSIVSTVTANILARGGKAPKIKLTVSPLSPTLIPCDTSLRHFCL